MAMKNNLFIRKKCIDFKCQMELYYKKAIPRG